MIFRNRAFQWALLVSGLFLIIFLRAPSILLVPALQYEDGAMVFAHFYQHRGLAQIFRFKLGYMPLIPNLMGYCSVRFPTRMIPYVMISFALAFTLLCYSQFFSARYRRWMPRDGARAILCILFALAPLGKFELLYNVDYTIWNALALFLLLIVCPLPQRGVYRYLYWIACNFLVWSHPMAIIAMPIVLYYMWTRKQDRWLYGLVAVNLVAHHVFAIESGGVFAGLGIAGIILKIAKALYWTFVVLGKTMFRTVAGVPLSHWANANHMRFLAVYWLIFLAIATARMMWKRPNTRLPVTVLAYLTFTMTFLSILARGPGIAGNIDYAPRYIHLQSMCLLGLYVMLAVYFAAPSKQATAPGSSSPPRSRARYALVMGIILVHYALLNTQPADIQEYYHYANPQNGRIVRKFFDQLATIEKKTGTRKGIYLVAPKIDDWNILIDTRSAKEKRLHPPTVTNYDS